MDRDAPAGLKHEIWTTLLSTGDQVVMMLNKGKTTAPISITWDQLGLKKNTRVVAYDLWEHEEISVPVFASSITKLVPSHGVVMFKISAKK